MNDSPSQQSLLRFRIEGMDCAEEISALLSEVGPVVGDEDKLNFNVFSRTMTVVEPSPSLPANAILQAIERAGLKGQIIPEATSSTAEDQSLSLQTSRLALTIVSGAATATAWLLGRLVDDALLPAGVGYGSKVLFLVAIGASLWSVFPKAIAAMRRIQPDMNALMVIAVGGAIAIGEWLEGATVAFLFSLSLLLESWSVNRARRAVAALMDLSPPVVRMIGPDGAAAEIPLNELAVGERFLVKPGERIPLDGQIVEGISDVNQAPITGESVPVAKSPGSSVYGGTINGDAPLLVQSTKKASETTLAKIIKMVGEAQAKRGPTEQWVQRFARVYTPAIIIVAMLVFLIPPLLLGGEWMDWLYRSLVLLVIACPCALVISTPVSIVAGLASAARGGVLIKGGEFLEAPASLKAIAFDKTGTLTAGRLRVVEVTPLNGHSEDELLQRATSLEQLSEHPIAQAVLTYAGERQVSATRVDNFKIIQGKGASGVIDGREFWLGSHRYLEERQQETPEIHERIEAMAKSGRTIIVVGNDKHVCGLIALADTLREGVRGILEDLRTLGVAHLIMLTGDNLPTAQAIGAQAGIDEIQAELLPADKVTAIESLVGEYKRVAMLGDGVNDAPALALATIGIAMGSMGSDAAIETADIALMADDLSRLPWLIRHSRRTLSIIRQNIVFSLMVKFLFFVLTMADYSSLWGAIAADTGASLLVVLNGMRLLHGASPGGPTETK